MKPTKIIRSKGSILVASFGTFSAGINIKNLIHVFFASGSKSPIRIPQSIGRALRKLISKKCAYIWDFVDILKYPKNHYKERKKMYNKEQYKVTEKIINVREYIKQNNL